jgi:hypothetical protein
LSDKLQFVDARGFYTLNDKLKFVGQSAVVASLCRRTPQNTWCLFPSHHSGLSSLHAKQRNPTRESTGWDAVSE